MNENQDIIDDDALEKAFQEASAPKKRTRDEIIQSLKKSRATENKNVDKNLEVAKQMGKFRPIGAPDETKGKKRKQKDPNTQEATKKKKRKVDAAGAPVRLVEQQQEQSVPQEVPKPKPRPRTPTPEFGEDFNIFADAGEYEGLGSEEDSDEESLPANGSKGDSPVAGTSTEKRGNWFGEAETPSNSAPIIPKRTDTPPEEQRPPSDVEMEDEPLKITRLQGLASSAVPSIKEILAMDEAAEREEKRKARKEKKKEKKKPSEETKINREVKQLEKYVATKR